MIPFIPLPQRTQYANAVTIETQRGREEAVHHRRYTFGYLVEDGRYFLR
jgi:hypothetical protein